MALAEHFCGYFVRSAKMKKRMSVWFSAATFLGIFCIVGFATGWSVIALLIVSALLALSVLLKRFEPTLRKQMEEIGKTKLW